MKQGDWHEIDRFLIGEAWVGSSIEANLAALCDEIGPRWAGTLEERRAAGFVRDRMEAYGLADARLEEFPLHTWSYDAASLAVEGISTPFDVLPFNHCAPVDVTAPLVDVRHGTTADRDAIRDLLKGSIALLDLGNEPFTPPEPIGYRLKALADAGAVAAVVIEIKSGRRMEYHSGADWRLPGYQPGHLPTVVTSREHGAVLRKQVTRNGASIWLSVESRLFEGTGVNTVAELRGDRWPDELLLLGGHHDTVIDAPGGNDNGSGTVVVMEVARVLARLAAETGIRPGRTIRFATWSAEEQVLQGSYAHVARHWPDGAATLPRLAINLDELSTATVKGLVLTFPHLRQFVQGHLDAMGGGYRCHVMAQLDASSDHFPFARRGIDAAICWRWRFATRHPDSEFHHEPGDTGDKVRPRELYEYVAFLARLLLRLSLAAPEEWPRNPITPVAVEERLRSELSQVVRTS